MRTLSAQLNSEVKRLTQLLEPAASYHHGMDDIYGIRRTNLNRALEMPALARLPKKQDKAAFLDISSSMYSQLLRPEYKIGDDMARKIEAALRLERNWMDNPPATSQPMGMDGEKMSEALVSVDKAVRKLGLEMNLAYVGDALIAAYFERLRHPDALDPTAYALYDRLVLEQLRGTKHEHEQRQQQDMEKGARGAGKDAPARPQARRGSAGRRGQRPH